MTDQLRLRPEKQNRPSTVITIDSGDRLLAKVRALNLSQQLDFGMRAPVVLERLADEIASLQDLGDLELQQRLTAARQDTNRLAAEQARRAGERERCPHCLFEHGRHGIACPRIAID